MFKFSKDGIFVSTVLDKRRAKNDGRYPVKVQVAGHRNQKYYPTGKNLTIEEWERLPTAKNREMVKIRESIENSFDIISSIVDDLASDAEFSYDLLNARLKRGNTDTLNTAMQAKADQMKDEDRIGTMMFYRNTLQRIESFSKTPVRIEAVTIDWLKRYEKFLLSQGRSRTTVGMDMRSIRVILNEAKESGIIKQSQYPFGKGKYEIQASEGHKRALTLEQVGMIARYDDGSDATAKYRDYWMFLYYCNGINVADFVKLKYRDIIDGEICFVRQKTERTTNTIREIRVIITESMQEIIDRRGNPKSPNNFIFPILDGTEDAMKLKEKSKYFTRAMNKRMAAVGEMLGIGNISTYTARHSFATVLKRSGANIAFISESLGHQNLKTTEHYLASFEKDERRKNAELLTKF